jgi:hypothetical protein
MQVQYHQPQSDKAITPDFKSYNCLVGARFLACELERRQNRSAVASSP